MQSSSWRAAGEFSFGGGEDGFHDGPAGVVFLRKIVPHLGADAMNLPGLLAALGRDNALCLQLLTAEGMVMLGIELGVGQHTADRRQLVCLSYQSGQAGAVVPRCLVRTLRQNQLPVYIDHR